MSQIRYTETPGTGIIKTGTIWSINPVQRLRAVTITDRLTIPLPEEDNQAAPKSYVDHALATSGRSRALGKGLTLSSDGTLSLDETQTFHKLTVCGTETLDELEPTDVVTVAGLNERVQTLAERDQVDTALGNLRQRVSEKLGELQVGLYETAGKIELSIAEKVARLASKSYVNSAIANLATTEYVDSLKERLVSMSYVDRILKDLVPRNAFEDLANTVVATHDYVTSLSLIHI